MFSQFLPLNSGFVLQAHSSSNLLLLFTTVQSQCTSLTFTKNERFPSSPILSSVVPSTSVLPSPQTTGAESGLEEDTATGEGSGKKSVSPLGGCGPRTPEDRTREDTGRTQTSSRRSRHHDGLCSAFCITPLGTCAVGHFLCASSSGYSGSSSETVLDLIPSAHQDRHFGRNR